MSRIAASSPLPTTPAPLALAQARALVAAIADPEIPVLTLADLGILREVSVLDDGTPGFRVVITPTYSGCPATARIIADIRNTLLAAGAAQVVVETRLSPAWSSTWLSPDARERLRAYGIAPPACGGSGAAVPGVAPAVAPVVTPVHWQPARRPPEPVPCPRCGSRETEALSTFGATACKALHRCRSCQEPFEYFKPI